MAPPELRITFTFIDGLEIFLDTRLYRCTADEVAFERRYGFTMASRAPIRAMREVERAAASANGNAEAAREEAIAGLPDADRAALFGMRDEWAAFFAWRCWRRAHPEALDFDAWVDTLAALSLTPRPEEAPDPTTPAPLGSSPS